MKNLIVFCLLLTACAKDSAPAAFDGTVWCKSGEALPTATGQPTVLVIGDSISIGYFPTIQTALAGSYDVVHNPCNAMTTTWTLSQIDSWLNSRASFAAITWNNGLWDVADWINVSDAEYVSNLHAIAVKIKAKTANPLFVLTTAVLPNTPNRTDANVMHKNALAVTAMAQEGIPVLDLHWTSNSFPQFHVTPTDVHFNALGSMVLGNAILSELNSRYGIQ